MGVFIQGPVIREKQDPRQSLDLYFETNTLEGNRVCML